MSAVIGSFLIIGFDKILIPPSTIMLKNISEKNIMI
jgi:hypothetical protein